MWSYLSYLDEPRFFRTKAREEPGFELTKPSTGQELQQTTKLQRSERYNGEHWTKTLTTTSTSS